MTPLFPRLLETERESDAGQALRAALRDRGSEEALQRVLATVGPLVLPPPLEVKPPLGSSVLDSAGVWPALKGIALGVVLGSASIGIAIGIPELRSKSTPTNASAPLPFAPTLTSSGTPRAQPVRAEPVTLPAADAIAGGPPRTPSNDLASASASALAPAQAPIALSSGSMSPGSVPTGSAPSGAHGRHRAAAVPRPAEATPGRGTASAMTAGAMVVSGSTSVSPLSREVLLLDRARRALAGGNPTAALAALDLRERELSTRALEPEALLIRIDALLASRQKAEAVRLARRALADNPRRSNAERLQRVIDKNQ